jgi:GNAT superfamily N-acetyltransferase
MTGDVAGEVAGDITGGTTGHRSTSEAVLSDGSSVQIRSLTPNDRDRLVRFFEGLSLESRRMRFFTPLAHLSDSLLHRLMAVDGQDSIVMIAERRGEIVGVGRANRTDPHTAEVAFTVSDELQGHGLGTVLLEVLASETARLGFDHFAAITKTENSSMLNVFRHVGFPAKIRHDPEDPSTMLVDLTLDDSSPSYLAAHRTREHHSRMQSVQRILEPVSIAVIGTSADQVADQVKAQGYVGSVTAANSRDTCRATLAGVSETIDLAIVTSFDADTCSIIELCGHAGVHAVLVGPQHHSGRSPMNRSDHQALLDTVRLFGMRLLGPGSLGVVSNNDTTHLHVLLKQFDQLPARAGKLAFMGNHDEDIVRFANELHPHGVGLAALVSLGDSIDITANDLVEYWGDQHHISVIAFHLNSFEDPAAFAQLTREISSRKQLIGVRTAVVRANHDHFDECGVAWVDTAPALAKYLATTS